MAITTKDTQTAKDQQIDALLAKADKALARGQYKAFDRHQEAVSRLLYGR